MAKIMLVEDDNNLREIYEARLLAEGYEIVAAKDGEEALALAVKEKPDLIISDVMMPKISGFDMLDILRTTPETKNTKVIMMTALSQAEDKARADKLGADRYLVKSQVTLEDVAKVAKEVLDGTPPAAEEITLPPVSNAAEPVSVDQPTMATPSPATSDDPAAPPQPTTDEPAVASTPAEPATTPAPSIPAPDPAAATQAAGSAARSTDDESSQIAAQIESFMATKNETSSDSPAATASAPQFSEPPAAAQEPVAPTPSPSPEPSVQETTPPADKPADPPQEAAAAPTQAMAGERVIHPINDTSAKVDLDALVKKQEEMDQVEAITAGAVSPPTSPETDKKPSNGVDPNSIAL
jgi:CheY-like chemotaxis protein